MGDSDSSTTSEMAEIWQKLWSEILKRIPAKELGKCICVCKTWYSLILSPQFITSHTKFHRTHLNFLLRSFTKASLAENGVESYHFFSDSEEISGLFNKGSILPFKTGVGLNFRVVGCVNGVVFLADTQFGNKHTFYLWNPLIKKHIKLPKPRIVFDVVGPYMHVFGFGYDSKNQDLKVVRVSYIQLSSGLDEIPPKTEVYSVKLGVWRWVFADDVTTCIAEDIWSQCCLQGEV
ncbi:F-box protein At4g22390-like [Chenopodium quinoa]|uniref:F-box protein At4g22390-like n=1 Tax=Chenopodium quinoa TaxID=63459 RepID=UPI000B78591A|nr:F-box protein At4g22390-like [Chenopodium quinoa]